MAKVNRRNLLSVITNVNLNDQGTQLARVEDSRRNSPPSPVANLWMFHDDKADAIYAIAGRPYMVHGAESEKTRILKALAPYDFALANASPLPDGFSAAVAGKTRNGVISVAPDGKYSKGIFSGVLEGFEHRIPAAIGIDGKIKNRVTVSSGKMPLLATRITERASNVGDAAPIQLVELPPASAISGQPPQVSAQARDILGKKPAAAPAKQGCFVATAAFGPQNASVTLLREYRDRIMTRSFPGRCAVRIYYLLSPPLAHFIEASRGRQALARRFLRPFIAGARRRLAQRQP
jgi:hypothetical protein